MKLRSQRRLAPANFIIRRRFAAGAALAIALAASGPVIASFESFVVDEVFSTADGGIQYVVLREAAGANGANQLGGRTLTMTSNAGLEKSFTFDADLPGAATANRRVLIATARFAALGLVAPDYILPERFLAIDGGMLDYAGIDDVRFAMLPIDGTIAWYRGGSNAPNIATNFAGLAASVPELPILVVEYYNASLDHYFISALAPDIDALDSGRIAGWTRTGLAFEAWADNSGAGAGSSPVCRFYIPPQHGNSHFLSASPDECQKVTQLALSDPNFSGYVFESPEVFWIPLPDPSTGNCPAGTTPVYRLWNGRADSNHRYTAEAVVRSMMTGIGYVAEGYGPSAVAMCTPGVPQLGSESRLSSASPFAPGCDGTAPVGTPYAGSEVEPMLAVDPRNANRIAAVWQQDRWSNGGASGILTGISNDGGRTWAPRRATFTRCTGGTAGNGGDYERASNAWVSIGADGTIYQSTLAFNGFTYSPGSVSAVLASRSTDGGQTWQNPVALIRDGSDFFNDKQAITADPTDARYVYAVWDRASFDNNGPTYFARSGNGGASWEPARAIYDPGPRNQTLGNQIVVLPDGTLVNFFTEIDSPSTSPLTETLAVIRSKDKGATWSAPVTVATLDSAGTTDAATGTKIRDAADLGSIAVGPGGMLVAVWQDSRWSDGARDAIALARSDDGGLTWSTPVRVNADPDAPAFVPAVAIAADGTIGVSYYDLRNNTPDGATIIADAWIARSKDAKEWSESHLAGPFDLAFAPRASNPFLGDYQALVVAGTAWIASYVKTNGTDPTNATDIYALPFSAPVALPTRASPTN